VNRLPQLKRESRRVVGWLGLLPLLQARRFDACCCGLSKTGTHSIAGVFKGYRSKHHPQRDQLLEFAIRYLEHTATIAEVTRFLERRDRKLWLEMEASTLHGTLIEPLVQACPQKMFILTVRDPYSWCDSWVDHNLNYGAGERFTVLDELRLRAGDYPHTNYDASLEQRGCAPLAAYFQLWAAHNQRVLEHVPPNRLLIVKTDEIMTRVPDIAAFVGAPVETMRPENAWQFRAPKKHNVLATLEPAYVRDTMENHCGDLMKQMFPEVR